MGRRDQEEAHQGMLKHCLNKAKLLTAQRFTSSHSEKSSLAMGNNCHALSWPSTKISPAIQVAWKDKRDRIPYILSIKFGFFFSSNC